MVYSHSIMKRILLFLGTLFPAQEDTPVPLRTWMMLIAAGWCWSLLSLVVHPGITKGIEDQRYYTIAILNQVEEELFAQDYITISTQTTGTLYDELIALTTTSPETLYQTYFWWTLFARWGLFSGMIFMAFAVGRHMGIAAIVPIISILPHTLQVNNALEHSTWIFLFETEIHPRLLATALLTLGLGIMMMGRHVMGWTVMALCIPIHIITSVLLFIPVGLWVLWEYLIRCRNIPAFLVFLCIPILSLGFLLTVGHVAAPAHAMPMDFFTIMDSEWLRVAYREVPHVFWHDKLTQAKYYWEFVFPIIVWSFALFTCRSVIAPRWRRFLTLFLVGVGVCLAIFAFIHWFPVGLLVQIQFLRIRMFLRLVLGVFIFVLLLRTLLNHQNRVAFSALLFATLLAFLWERSELLPLFPAAAYALWAAETGREKSLQCHYIVMTTCGSFLFFYALWWLWDVRPPYDYYLLECIQNVLTRPGDLFAYLVSRSVRLLIPALLVGAVVLASQQKYAPLVATTVRRTVLVCFMTISCTLYAAYGFATRWDDFTLKDDCRGRESTSTCVLRDTILTKTQPTDLFALHTEVLLADKLPIAFVNIYAHRSVFVGILGQGQTTFSREAALEYDRRWEMASRLEETWPHLATQYGVDYIILPAQDEFLLDLPLLYADSALRVYKTMPTP